MRSIVRFLLLSACLLLSAYLAAPPALADPFVDRAANDTVDKIASDDPAMARAVVEARATLPAFLKLAESPPPDATRFAVKVGLGPDGGKEFFWITPFTAKRDLIIGRLANRPERVTGYKAGQEIVVTLDQVTDWMYFAGHRMKGNYSACALLAHEPAEALRAFEERYGQDCTAR